MIKNRVSLRAEGSCKMFLVILACSFIAVRAQVPTAPATHGNGTGHHHHESPEMEHWTFNFESHTGYMVVLKENECYLWRLTDSEKTYIHTDAGLRSVEIRVISEIEKAITTTVDGLILNTRILNSCGKHASKFFIVH